MYFDASWVHFHDLTGAFHHWPKCWTQWLIAFSLNPHSKGAFYFSFDWSCLYHLNAAGVLLLCFDCIHSNYSRLIISLLLLLRWVIAWTGQAILCIVLATGIFQENFGWRPNVADLLVFSVQPNFVCTGSLWSIIARFFKTYSAKAEVPIPLNASVGNRRHIWSAFFFIQLLAESKHLRSVTDWNRFPLVTVSALYSLFTSPCFGYSKL